LKEAGSRNVEYLGRLSVGQVLEEIGRSKALFVPSLWYEGFPMVVRESFAVGTPVYASRLGALEEIVRDGENGHLFEPESVEQMASYLKQIDVGAVSLAGLSAGALKDFEGPYSAARNLEQLENCYELARLRSLGRADCMSADHS
jgi:glycosyltransferase involved in cell wall biosynthesis